MVSVRLGKEIASTFIDQSKRYVDGRSIENLKKLGGLTDLEAQVLERVNGVLANRRNDRPEIDELVRMEQPDFLATLFPEEKAALKSAWRVLEWQDVPAAAPAPELAPLASQIKVVPRSSGELPYDDPFAIAELPAELQRSARRLQMVLAGDAKAATVSQPALEQGMEDERFTAKDHQDFAAMRTFIRNWVRANHTVRDEARVEVPPLRHESIWVPHGGQVRFSIERDTRAKEVRALYVNQQSRTLAPHLELTRTSKIEVEVPAGHKALLFRANGDELLLDEGKSEPPLASGTYRVELWRDGEVVERTEVNLPEVAPRETFDGGHLLDHVLVIEGQPVPRVLVKAEQVATTAYYSHNHTKTVQYEYGATAGTPLANPNAEIVDSVRTPTFAPGPGRYELETPRHTFVLDVFASGAMHLDGEAMRWANGMWMLQPQGFGNVRLRPEGYGDVAGARVAVGPEQRIS